MVHTIPGFPDLVASTKVFRPFKREEIQIFIHTTNGTFVGQTGAVLDGDYPSITTSDIVPAYRGKGLYPKMLMILLAEVKGLGYKGIMSKGFARVSDQSDDSWRKFASREPRVTSSMDAQNRINYYLAGLHSSAKEPVYMECQSHFSRLLNETIYGKCVWHVDPSVVSAVIECAKTKTMNVLSRNMDTYRDKYPWRVSFFDRETGEAIGHRYGTTASNALNFDYYDQCTVVDVKRR